MSAVLCHHKGFQNCFIGLPGGNLPTNLLPFLCHILLLLLLLLAMTWRKSEKDKSTGVPAHVYIHVHMGICHVGVPIATENVRCADVISPWHYNKSVCPRSVHHIGLCYFATKECKKEQVTEQQALVSRFVQSALEIISQELKLITELEEGRKNL